MAANDLYPEWWPLPNGASIILTILILYLIHHQLSSQKLDPQEPPVLKPFIPVIGHVVGMALLGGRYIKNLGLRNQSLPIFTLPVPGSRIYVVTDPSLAAAVQRASKVLSFTPVVPEVTERVLGLDRATVEITRRNLDPGPGDERGFLADIQDLVYAQLGPGEYLTTLSLAAAREMRREIASVFLDSPQPIDLLSWVRHLVTASTAKYLYGPRNPLAEDPSLEAAFWDFDHGLGALLMNIFPSITARKAYVGRERLAAALHTYLRAGHHRTGSAIVQKRVEIALQHGWALPAVAREELSFLFAGIVNATTSTFWILLHLYADPSLLACVREEVCAILETPEVDQDKYTDLDAIRSSLRLTDLRDSCPMLVAVYRECLRLGSDTYSTRIVKTNYLLANQYFLAKDSVVQIAGGVIHADSRIWGDDVDSFNPKRFLAPQEGGAWKAKQNNTFHPAAFRAFGGGKTLCPGRHFAMNEILAFVALVVLQFDMKPAHGEKIEVPRKNDGVLPVHILEPIHPVKVLISRRSDAVALEAQGAEFFM
ncbi:cytochrome P450 [Annulohypoxylon bovei var. microspora]|nr:cytochrome P450 [Annulohypoxylon bovei var. microspora]